MQSVVSDGIFAGEMELIEKEVHSTKTQSCRKRCGGISNSTGGRITPGETTQKIDITWKVQIIQWVKINQTMETEDYFEYPV